MVQAMGLTRGGSLYYSTPGFRYDIFSASIDPDLGRLLEGPQKVRLPYEGHNFQPRLSPDGNHLAYVSLRGPGMRNYLLNIFSFESGEVREIRRRYPHIVLVIMDDFGVGHFAPYAQHVSESVFDPAFVDFLKRHQASPNITSANPTRNRKEIDMIIGVAV